MSKVKIKIVNLGHFPFPIDQKKVRKWKSDLFEIISPITSVTIINNSDGYAWEFTDENLLQQLPSIEGADMLLAITNVPIQDNYYVRRVKENHVCMTYHTMSKILELDNIPLENLILRVLYTISFAFKRYGGKLPITREIKLTHDETRGCIFDMNGTKMDVIYSLNKPQLCSSCEQSLLDNNQFRIEKEVIEKVKKELKKIQKRRYFRLANFIKQKPILAIFLSALFAIIIGIISSIIASLIWEKL